MNKHLVIFLSTLLFFSCSNSTKKEEASGPIKSIPAPEFSNLFLNNIGGFTGGDGSYSVLLPDNKTIWIFGDTFIDGVLEDHTREMQDPIYIRNSLVLQENNDLQTLFKRKNEKNASFACPYYSNKEIDEYKQWFWPGDGFIEEGQLKIFFSEFTQQDTGMWGFQWESTWIGSYSLPNLEEIELIKILDKSQSQIHFGHAVHVDDIYTYVYGAGNGKPHAARYPNGQITSPWEFFNGSNWSINIEHAAPIADIDGSEQFSIFKYQNKYVLLCQMGRLSPEIFSYTSSSPYGPWKNKRFLYTTPLPESPHNLFTYNALAHPQFIQNDQLLVSYNTNSTELKDHYLDANIYRPRFIWVPLNLIDSSFSN